MFCKNCGENNSDSFKFCQFCGTLLGSGTPEPLDEVRSATVEIAQESNDSELDDWLIDEDDSALSPDLLAHHVDDDKNGNQAASLKSTTVKGAAAPHILAQNTEPKDIEIEEKIEIEEVVEEKKDAAPVAARICKQCGEEVAPGHRNKG